MSDLRDEKGRGSLIHCFYFSDLNAPFKVGIEWSLAFVRDLIKNTESQVLVILYAAFNFLLRVCRYYIMFVLQF